MSPKFNRAALVLALMCGPLFAADPAAPIIAEGGIVAPEGKGIRLVERKFEPSTVLEPFKTGDAFKLILAAYSDDLNELLKIKNPTEADVKKAMRKKKEMEQLLVTYEEVVKVAPIVSTLSIQFGVEIPMPILSKLPLIKKLPGTLGGQASTGVTFIMTRDGATDRKQFSWAWSHIAGANFTVGRRHETLQKGNGINGISPAVAIIVPLNEELHSLKVGDLQGMYYGTAGEVSTVSTANGWAHNLSVGVYVRPRLKLALPDAALVYFFHGVAGETGRPSVQGESLWYGVMTSKDDSSIQHPIPWLNDGSPHSVKSRKGTALKIQNELRGLTADEVLSRARDAQIELEKKMDE